MIHESPKGTGCMLDRSQARDPAGSISAAVI
jgi:hypothetical protein